MTAHEEVQTRLAQRVAERIAVQPSLLLIAPAEYSPRRIGREALRLRVGTAGFDRIVLPRDSDALGGAMVRGRPLLVEAEQCRDLEALGPLLGAVSAPNMVLDRLVVVLECDGCDAPHYDNYDLVLDHRDLTLHAADVAALVPWVDDDEQLHAVLRETGGVPALVAARMTSKPGPDDPLPAVAQGWADRMYRQVISDRLLSLHLWVGRVHEETMSVLASHLQRRMVSVDEVRRARSVGVISDIKVAEPGFPGALASALQAIEYVRAPARHRETRHTLAAAAMRVTGMAVPELIRVLTALSDWPALDAVLGRSLPLLAEFGPSERITVFRAWPAEAPAGLTHLAAARRLIDPQRVNDSAPGLLTSWYELALLYSHANLPSGTLAHRLRTQLMDSATPGRSWTLEDARRASGQAEMLLAEECRRVEAEGLLLRSDEVAMLVRMQLVVAEAAVRCGEMALAQTLAARCRRLTLALGSRRRWYPALLPSVLAHTAFTAAKVGLAGVASARLSEYADAQASFTRSAAADEALVALTRTHIAVARGDLDRGTPLRHVDPERDFAPEEAYVHALQVLLLHGPSAAVEWLTGMLSRTSWSESPSWAWWAIHGLVIALHVRTGQPGRAQQWYDRVRLPPVLDLAVRADIELALDRHSVAERLAEQVSEAEHATNRWRLLALGVRLGCLLATGRRHGADVPVSSENWDMLVDSVALFTDPVRAVVTPHLTSPVVRELPGLAVVAEPAAPTQREVRLTPRQIEVLRELQTGDTMSTIAKRLFLGTETVRSTAKEMYRRMGVHDRDGAVQVGRVLGFL